MVFVLEGRVNIYWVKPHFFVLIYSLNSTKVVNIHSTIRILAPPHNLAVIVLKNLNLLG